jgi:glycosyltransferase involved in cell wall biosynthesis
LLADLRLEFPGVVPVLTDGETSMLVKSGDPDTLPTAIKYVLADIKLVRRLAKNAAECSDYHRREHGTERVISFLR